MSLLLNPHVFAGPFDVETSIPWHSLFWAGGTQFQALGLSDGASVSTWPNETSEADAAQGAALSQPTYRAADATMNSKPSVQGDAGDSMSTGSFSVAPSGAASIIVVGRTTATSANRFMVDGIGSSNRNAMYRTSGSAWAAFAGSTIAGGSANTSMHVWRAYFPASAGAGALTLDGSTLSTGAPGSQTVTGLRLFADWNAANQWNGYLAFVGLYQGDITTHPRWSHFQAWVSDEYGLTLA